nr:hypothetical protein [Pandoravirus aubagnensis]
MEKKGQEHTHDHALGAGRSCVRRRTTREKGVAKKEQRMGASKKWVAATGSDAQGGAARWLRHTGEADACRTKGKRRTAARGRRSAHSLHAHRARDTPLAPQKKRQERHRAHAHKIKAYNGHKHNNNNSKDRPPPQKKEEGALGIEQR